MPTRGADWPMQYETVRSWLHRMNKPCPARFHGWNYRATFKIYFDIMEYLHHLHHTHTSIIVSYLYMRICHPMKWWILDDTLFLHAPFKTAKWLMDLLPKLKKKKPMPRGKLKNKNSQSLWIPVIRCQEFAPLVWQVDDIRTYLHSFAQRITAIQVEWYSLVNICWKRKTWNLKACESKWKCQCFQGCKEWSLRG